MNIIVTGSSRGLGLSLVQELLNRKKHLIFGISRSSAPQLLGSFNNYIHIQADLILSEGLFKIYEEISTKVVTVDAIINNAGLLINKPFKETSITEIEQLMAVNFVSPSRLIQSLLPLLKPGSHIMNIGSMGGIQGSVKFPGLSFYSASKGALTILTEVLAEEFKPLGIHVNCLAPGSVQTEMLAHAFPGYQASFTPRQLAVFLADFAERNYQFFNGKTLQLAITTP
ncbi:MAG: SDR family oxidoreductase [Bacteroidales bacterium]|jgi:short-subunit dehydrogenase|nr:SDR family oxidoreductase [Bacteroidales bacterium]